MKHPSIRRVCKCFSFIPESGVRILWALGTVLSFPSDFAKLRISGAWRKGILAASVSLLGSPRSRHRSASSPALVERQGDLPDPRLQCIRRLQSVTVLAARPCTPSIKSRRNPEPQPCKLRRNTHKTQTKPVRELFKSTVKRSLHRSIYSEAIHVSTLDEGLRHGNVLVLPGLLVEKTIAQR